MENITYFIDGKQFLGQIPNNLTREEVDKEMKKGGITKWYLTDYPRLPSK